MGWTGTALDHNRPVRAIEAIETECGSAITAGVLDCARIPGYEGYVAYAAVQEADHPDRVWGLVVLYSTSRSDYDGGRWLFTKAVEESQGPAETCCPTRILDRLSPIELLYGATDPDTSAAYATTWRERCRAYHEARAETAIAPGEMIELATPVELTNGATVSRLRRRGQRGNRYVCIGGPADGAVLTLPAAYLIAREFRRIPATP